MSAEFDSFAQNYEAELAKGLKLTGETAEHFLRCRIQWLVHRLGARPVSSVLDFGCGTGNATPVLLEAFHEPKLFGYDVSTESLDRARHTWGHHPTTSFIDGTPDQQVALAHTNGVFHHIPKQDRADCVRFIWEALEPGGILAFFENNPLNPLMVYSMKQVAFDRDAVTLFPWESWNLLRRGGFQPLKLDFLFFFPAFLKRLRVLEPYLTWLPVGAQYLILAQKPKHSTS